MTGPRLDVLVVSDNPYPAWCAGVGLAGRVFDVRVAGSAEAALGSAADAPPDAVLVDFVTPGVDGFALARALRHQPRGDKTPLLLVAVKAGADPRLSAATVDLLLSPDAPGVADVLVGVLSRYREFLADRRVCETDRDPAIAAPRHRAGPLTS